ncbi:MAG TPA: 1-acyl-sn-glycerol-3-phosphate acyltransferase [Gemmatimonadales bacterium]|jgi:glycerol-3-phosphate O-acyltransferase|nr:1-acyl-sn-glycerol-3-phosphate acyltransferase [Gemmatimonadales bacterium]
MNERVWWIAGIALAGLVLAAALAVALQERLRRSALRAIHQFQARLDRYKLVKRDIIREQLLQDPLVLEAMAQHQREHPMTDGEVRRLVNEYIDEIVPFFNVLSYYRIGYNLSRFLINLLYKASIEYQDREALGRVPREDMVVYLMNHRSNADYVVVAYVLARVVSISYAVGEWARVWPLEYVFKSFGSYFIRRRYREPLYHAVLERYVQLITRNGVTQGIFPEGGLSRDGALRPPKIGLIDYILRTMNDPTFAHDIWLIPVGINYDRVLEDRSLIRERVIGVKPLSRWRQLGGVAAYLWSNLLRFFTGRLRRYGRVAVSLGTPVSVRAWLATQPSDLLQMPKDQRLPHVQQLAELTLERIGQVIPVTPVPLCSAALLSFNTSVVPRARLLERIDELRDRLTEFNARVVRRDLAVDEVWDRAWRMFRMRRILVEQGTEYVILPAQRPLLEYYANSIAHLLPEAVSVTFTPAGERDPTLPRLARRDEMDIMTAERAVPMRQKESR